MAASIDSRYSFRAFRLFSLFSVCLVFLCKRESAVRAVVGAVVRAVAEESQQNRPRLGDTMIRLSRWGSHY